MDKIFYFHRIKLKKVSIHITRMKVLRANIKAKFHGEMKKAQHKSAFCTNLLVGMQEEICTSEKNVGIFFTSATL